MKISEQKRQWYDEQMKRLIVDNGMTKTDIAKALGIMPQALNSIETGVQGLSDKFLDKFADTFSIKGLHLEMASIKDETTESDRLLKIIESQQETISQLTKVIARMSLSEEKGDIVSRTA